MTMSAQLALTGVLNPHRWLSDRQECIGCGATYESVERGFVAPLCDACGSANLELDGWDIDKCRDCGHWRYR
jgi:DNA-directed RNA polymerase subunit RPC12/RpoP